MSNQTDQHVKDFNETKQFPVFETILQALPFVEKLFEGLIGASRWKVQKALNASLIQENADLKAEIGRLNNITMKHEMLLDQLATDVSFLER